MEHYQEEPRPGCEFAIMTVPPGLGGVELLHARYVTQRFSRHFHEGYALGCIEAGSMRFRYMGQEVVAARGQVNLVVPGEVHDGHGAAPGGWAYRMFYLRPEVLAGATGDALPDFRMGVIDDPGLAARIVLTHRLLERPWTPRMEKETRLMALLREWIGGWAEERCRRPRAGREHRAVARAREVIRAEYGEDLSLGRLAREAGLSPWHLVRVFEGEVGVTPHVYLTQVRVDRARRMLAGPGRIADIAVECGFADQAHLTRLFKRQTGMTPGGFRKNLQNRAAGQG
ncbi:helix-turn-helix domain-containing protein [Pseudodesulfovibrio sp. F-1]|uniref:Helix-turn-helix domain-containing protein n=1 Tax=Pseudodesulfovibrio alkaliphilus TaxID=2661613 RepID=A0A7K1KM57_9BACT|nr:AraC family transcriptional regulator [Pseudodesulfovibrio alkaliphilus]MUM77178.1 helix-turn-helix domain-containing protein [Pseudodesulfovibrio alkaliphilus]